MRKCYIVILAVLVALMCSSVALATDGSPGGGHEPVTICHKPGTPAEKQLTVDNDAVPGHLGHGDTLGPCENPPANPATCPEGYDEGDLVNGTLLCLKTVTNTVEVPVPGPTVTVYRDVPGPTVTIEVPGPVQLVPIWIYAYKDVEKIKTKIVKVKSVVYRTKIKKVKVPVYGLCKMPSGQIAVPGAG